MYRFIASAIDRKRTVFMLFSLLLVAGLATLFGIPKESNPDISIPTIYVSVTHTGISPEDADKLIYEPIERQIQGLDGLKEMVSIATYGHLSVQLEFYSDVDIERALDDVRVKIADARPEFPGDTEEPVIKEINVALFPVMVVTLSGSVDEPTLYYVAERLQSRIEALPGVLEVDIQGKREQIGEIIVDPATLDNYGLSLFDVGKIVSNNSVLVATEDLENSAGHFGVKVPGKINDINELMTLPVKKSDDQLVLFRDIAVGRLGYKDPDTGATINGHRGVSLEIKKRIGANIIETLDEVKIIAQDFQENMPEGLEIGIIQDESEQISIMLNDLFNNVLVSTLLVMLIILLSLGMRSSSLVGLAIPGAFLMGIMVIAAMGDTLNMVVLFALILSVGMLVDGAIVVTEYADRRLAEGMQAKPAYTEAAQRMSWPIIASTATTLAVFLPLLFWPGIMGGFMKYLPMTLLFTLSASLIMALVVIPAIGSSFRAKQSGKHANLEAIRAAETGQFGQLKGFSAFYVRTLKLCLQHPIKIMLSVFITLILSFVLYAFLGKGAEFFPDVDSDVALVDVRARGNLSFTEKEALVKSVENRFFDMKEIDSLYRTIYSKAPNDSAADLIGRIQLDFVDWKSRRTAEDILRDIDNRTAGMPGIIIETRKKDNGPVSGLPVQLELRGRDDTQLKTMLSEVRNLFEQDPDLIDIIDDLPLEGVEWELQINREEAVRFGTNVSSIGSIINMATGGQVISQFQPDSATEELDIVLRYPSNQRNLSLLDQLNVQTMQGSIPLSNFVKKVPIERKGDIVRVDGLKRYIIQADVKPGVNANTKILELGEKIQALDWYKAGVEPKFRGDFEEQAETGVFLMSAFAIAIFMMMTILVTQFNSFYQATLIMSAIVLSIAGVLIGLILRGEPFGIVMSGMGIIALAGIVVNNNIVLIDTYNRIKESGVAPVEAALRTGAMRMRPVLLTAITTIVGLMPMVFQWTIDLIHREISVGAPSSQWWTQLSTAIAGGLAFATILTLILTPCLLVFGDRKTQKREAD